jgi:hypothetical protein
MNQTMLNGKIDARGSGELEERIIGEDEEIIGIYGVKEQEKYISSIGFIVWRPPN